MRHLVAYCSTCKKICNLTGRKTWQKHAQMQKRQDTRIYHCENCQSFVLSEKLPILRQTMKKEIHYGFGAHST